jgi:hypothetical protein
VRFRSLADLEHRMIGEAKAIADHVGSMSTAT